MKNCSDAVNRKFCYYNSNTSPIVKLKDYYKSYVKTTMIAL